jgi:hypothetical protein
MGMGGARLDAACHRFQFQKFGMVKLSPTLVRLFGVIATLLFISVAGRAAPLLPVPVSTVPCNRDLNPYGVSSITSTLGGALKPGDILISNFNNSQNTMFLGTTIVDIRNGAQTASPFTPRTPQARV